MKKQKTSIYLENEALILKNIVKTPGFLTDNYRLATLTKKAIYIYESENQFLNEKPPKRIFILDDFQFGRKKFKIKVYSVINKDDTIKDKIAQSETPLDSLSTNDVEIITNNYKRNELVKIKKIIFNSVEIAKLWYDCICKIKNINTELSSNDSLNTVNKNFNFENNGNEESLKTNKTVIGDSSRNNNSLNNENLRNSKTVNYKKDNKDFSTPENNNSIKKKLDYNKKKSSIVKTPTIRDNLEIANSNAVVEKDFQTEYPPSNIANASDQYKDRDYTEKRRKHSQISSSQSQSSNESDEIKYKRENKKIVKYNKDIPSSNRDITINNYSSLIVNKKNKVESKTENQVNEKHRNINNKVFNKHTCNENRRIKDDDQVVISLFNKRDSKTSNKSISYKLNNDENKETNKTYNKIIQQNKLIKESSSNNQKEGLTKKTSSEFFNLSKTNTNDEISNDITLKSRKNTPKYQRITNQANYTSKNGDIKYQKNDISDNEKIKSDKDLSHPSKENLDKLFYNNTKHYNRNLFEKNDIIKENEDNDNSFRIFDKTKIEDQDIPNMSDEENINSNSKKILSTMKPNNKNDDLHIKYLVTRYKLSQNDVIHYMGQYKKPIFLINDDEHGDDNNTGHAKINNLLAKTKSGKSFGSHVVNDFVNAKYSDSLEDSSIRHNKIKSEFNNMTVNNDNSSFLGMSKYERKKSIRSNNSESNINSNHSRHRANQLEESHISHNYNNDSNLNSMIELQENLTRKNDNKRKTANNLSITEIKEESDFNEISINNRSKVLHKRVLKGTKSVPKLVGNSNSNKHILSNDDYDKVIKSQVNISSFPFNAVIKQKTKSEIKVEKLDKNALLDNVISIASKYYDIDSLIKNDCYVEEKNSFSKNNITMSNTVINSKGLQRKVNDYNKCNHRTKASLLIEQTLFTENYYIQEGISIKDELEIAVFIITNFNLIWNNTSLLQLKIRNMSQVFYIERIKELLIGDFLFYEKMFNNYRERVLHDVKNISNSRYTKISLVFQSSVQGLIRHVEEAIHKLKKELHICRNSINNHLYK